MKNILLILILCLGFLELYAQVNANHWMHNAIQWKSYYQLADQFVAKDHLTDTRELQSKAEGATMLNYHAVTTNPIAFEQAITDLSQLTLFVVYWSPDSRQEQLIWAISDDKQDHLLSTTERLANLDDYRFLNYIDQPKSKPIIQTYFQNEPMEAASTIKFGGLPKNKNIPIQPFDGTIAEVILFDQVLPPQKRQQVQTYLSLKYGISSSENYISTTGQRLKTVERSPFRHRIAGLGRNESFGLHQKQASSSDTDIFLSLGLKTIERTNALNPNHLNEDTYLIWADDNQPLAFRQRQVLEIPSLERLWEMTVTGDFSKQHTELQVDQSGFALGAEEMVYLVVYENEDKQQKHYYKAHTTTAAGVAIFKDIIWDKDRSGKDYFSFAVGKSLIPNTVIELPQCANNQNGQLRLGAIGGQPPYQFELTTDEGKPIDSWEVSNESDLPRVELAIGTYQLLLTDQSGAQYAETFFLQAADAPVVDLKDQYFIAAGETLTLNAQIEAANISYEWRNEAGKVVAQQSTIDITDQGKYELTINKAGCSSKQWIEVLQLNEANNIAAFELSPNPSIDGVFRIMAQLDQAAPSQLNIYNLNGQLLQSQSFGTSQWINHQDRVLDSGIYFIELVSRESKQTKKLVVQRE